MTCTVHGDGSDEFCSLQTTKQMIEPCLSCTSAGTLSGIAFPKGKALEGDMRIALGTAVALALSAPISALAADLPVKARPVPPPVAVYNWSGFYIGGNAGYSFGRDP